MSDNINRNNRIAKNTMFLYMRMVVVLLVSLYTTRVILNALGVVDYGINNVVAGFVSMFAFLNTSMSNGIQRYYNYTIGKEGESSLTKVYNTAFIIQVLISLIIIILLETIGLWYLENQMVIPADRMNTARWIYQFAVISLVLVVLQIPYSAAIMAHERMDYYAYVSLIDVALKLGFAIWLPHVSIDRLFVYGCYSLGIGILNYLMYFVYSKLHFKTLRIQFHLYKDLFKDMLSFSGWNIFGTLAYMLKGQGLNILLNAFFGPVVNAARGVSMMINNALHGFQVNIVVSFRPQIIQSYAEGDFMRVKKLMYSLSKISYLMLFVLSLPVMLELKYILHLWLGESVPEYTESFTVLILLIMIISSLNTPISQIVHATGKMKRYQIGTSICVCSILPASWIVLKLGYAPVSVYCVSLIMIIINQYVSLLLLKEVFNYRVMEYIREVIRPCIFVSVVGFVISFLPHYFMSFSFLRLVVVTLVAILTILSVSFLTLSNDEKKLISNLVTKRIKNRLSKTSK